jgi:hypothetical protein
VLVVFAACLLIAVCRAVSIISCVLSAFLFGARVLVHVNRLVLGYINSQWRTIYNRAVKVRHHHFAAKIISNS